MSDREHAPPRFQIYNDPVYKGQFMVREQRYSDHIDHGPFPTYEEALAEHSRLTEAVAADQEDTDA